MATSSTAQAVSNAALNIKRTQQWKDFGNAVFTNKVLSIQPSALVSLMQAAGIKVPKGAIIGADVAQIVAAGGAFAADINTGASISSFALPTSAAIQASVNLLETVGLMDPKSPAAQLLTLGADIGMVVATGGVNVIADLKLVMDLVTNLFSNPMNAAQAQATNQLNNMLAVRRTNQVNALSQNFAAYQNGRINTFDLIFLVAKESPDFFDNYLPQYQKFLPPTLVTLSSSASASSCWGLNNATWTQSYTFSTITLTPQQIIQNIWQQIILPMLGPYKDYNLNNPNKIQSQHLALLSLLPPYPKQFPENFDVSNYLRNLYLTPADLGGPSVANVFKANQPVTTQTFNGVDQTVISPPTTVLPTAQYQKLLDAENRGYYGYMLRDKSVGSFYSQWGNATLDQVSYYPYLQKFLSTGSYTDPGISLARARYQIPQVLPIYLRDFRNYWSALSIISQLRGDPYFSQVSGEIQSYDFMSTLNNFERAYKYLMFKSHARVLNDMALQNIAFFLNTTVDKLVYASDYEEGKPAVFKTKG